MVGTPSNIVARRRSIAASVADRKKDLIITGGYKVYPAEIERVVAMHPSVVMVAVGRQNDALKGEVPNAYVVPKPGVTPDEASIIDFCRHHLAGYKVPLVICAGSAEDQYRQDLTPSTRDARVSLIRRPFALFLTRGKGIRVINSQS